MTTFIVALLLMQEPVTRPQPKKGPHGEGWLTSAALQAASAPASEQVTPQMIEQNKAKGWIWDGQDFHDWTPYEKKHYIWHRLRRLGLGSRTGYLKSKHK